MSTQQTSHASYAASHSAHFSEFTNARSAEIEVLRSSFDIDGIKVELTYDSGRRRYSVATRWAYLTHIPVPFDTAKWRRIGLERASAVFEAVCLHSADKVIALLAKKHAMALDPAHFNVKAAYEREVLRRTRNSLQPQAVQSPLFS